jgi:hypothetical protein
MACLGAVQRVEGPVADGEHGLLEPGTAPLCVLVRAAVIPAGAQRRPVARC